MSRLCWMQSGFSRVTVATGLLISLLIWCSSALAVPQKLGDTLATNSNPHNLSSGSASAINAEATATDEICIFCHTPHSASSRGALWSRPDITIPFGGGTFPIYGVVTPGDTILIDTILAADYNQGGEYPNGATRLCLSCHDGVTAIGEVIPGAGGVLSTDLGPMSTMVIDLSTSHPISFVYNAAVEAVLDNKPIAGTNLYKLPSAGILDDQSRMQCTACHDPHLDTNEPGYTLPMWRNYTGDENADYEGTCGECHVGGSTSGGLVNTMPLPLPGPIH